MPGALAKEPPVPGSAEDLFWAKPITIHDFKNHKDLHNFGVSFLSLTEMEFVRLGDGLIDFSLRTHRRPIAHSLDSLEYAYSELPQIYPVRRTGQLFDALQLRQLSVSDFRILHALISFQKIGGITPIMQTRIYKCIVFVEDLIDDADRALMLPINAELSRERHEKVRFKMLGYAGEGLGYGRFKVFSGLRIVNKEVIKLGVKAINRVEAVENSRIRSKRMKQNKHALIYSRMPLEVYRKNFDILSGVNKLSIAGLAEDWYEVIQEDASLGDQVRAKENNLIHDPKILSGKPVFMVAEYETWEKVPMDLRRYVIDRNEFAGFLRAYHDSLEENKAELKVDFKVPSGESGRI